MLRKLLSFFSRDRSDAGAWAERLAADWLRRERGFTVLARNWRSPADRRLEIDLVCQDQAVVVFVEVKARSADALVPGYYAVNWRKKRALLQACKAYLGRLPQKPRTFRFDVVEVSIPSPLPAATATAAATSPVVLHFENVPLFAKSFRG